MRLCSLFRCSSYVSYVSYIYTRIIIIIIIIMCRAFRYVESSPGKFLHTDYSLYLAIYRVISKEPDTFNSRFQLLPVD